MLFDTLFKNKKCPNCGTYHDPTLNECPQCHKSNELFALNRYPKRVVFLHPFAQLGMFLVGFSYFGMFILEFIIAGFNDVLPEDKVQKGLLVMTIVYVTILIGLLVIALFSGRRKIFVDKFTDWRDYLYGLAYAFAIILANFLVGLIMSIFFKDGDNANQEAINAVATGYPLLSIPILCVVGPICEELTYRVGLYSFIRRFNKYAAIIVTSLVFAFIHMELIDSDIIMELQALPSYIASGLVLAIAYEDRGPACSITAHVIFNLVAVGQILIK